MTKISRALLQALRSCPLEELGFANCRQISTEAWQLLGLGCAWQLKKASFSRCGLVANFALGFGGFPILGDSLPPQRTFGQTSPLLLKNLHEPTSLAWSQFAATRCFDADSKGVEGAPALLEVLARCPLQDGRWLPPSVRTGLVTPGGLL